MLARAFGALVPSTNGRAATDPACAPDTTVAINSGPVCGILQDGDYQWLGIPYAAPPVGPLRWKPPQPPSPWTTTLPATAFGSQCVQVLAPSSVAGSENCLFINVVRPAGPQPASGLPVLVHIHGGGFIGGSGNVDYSLLANSGREVVVSMNYRLNIFGFLADRALGEDSGDYGLEDQQAALRWVKQNVRAFGGNAGNVTIFGESAGGSSVCDQIASPTAHGLFEKAFSVSGEYSTLFGSPNQVLNFQDCKSTPPTQAVADRAGESFVAAVGCTSAAEVADCLRRVPAAAVLAAAGGGFTASGTGTISPTLNARVLPLSLRQSLVRGTANRVRVIAGTNRDENLAGTATTPDQYRALVDQQFGAYAPAVLQEYPLERFYSPFIAFRTVAADAYTVCPAIVTEQLLAKRMPAWEYELDHGDAPPSYLPPNLPNGSYHVGAYFLFPGFLGTTNLDANNLVLQQQEVADLTTFARTGNPTAKFTPFWPEFNDTHEVMSWQPGGDSEVMTTAQISLNHHCDFWNAISPKP
ncbi:MAG: carboxylesterase family protein [Solirubrobacterales bacterium]|nr:carboxylesterase family protein [Solirubrobacterales bacterium]